MASKKQLIYRGHYIEILDKPDENGKYVIISYRDKEVHRTSLESEAYEWINAERRRLLQVANAKFSLGGTK